MTDKLLSVRLKNEAKDCAEWPDEPRIKHQIEGWAAEAEELERRAQLAGRAVRSAFEECAECIEVLICSAANRDADEIKNLARMTANALRSRAQDIEETQKLFDKLCENKTV